jgi:hypothetical protein
MIEETQDLPRTDSAKRKRDDDEEESSEIPVEELQDDEYICPVIKE